MNFTNKAIPKKIEKFDQGSFLKNVVQTLK